MSLDHSLISDPMLHVAEEESATEVSDTFLRHAVNVWARERGLAGETLSGVVNDVLQYATTTASEARFGRGNV